MPQNTCAFHSRLFLDWKKKKKKRKSKKTRLGSNIWRFRVFLFPLTLTPKWGLSPLLTSYSHFLWGLLYWCSCLFSVGEMAYTMPSYSMSSVWSSPEPRGIWESKLFLKTSWYSMWASAEIRSAADEKPCCSQLGNLATPLITAFSAL